jgi:hypothetical protein
MPCLQFLTAKIQYLPRSQARNVDLGPYTVPTESVLLVGFNIGRLFVIYSIDLVQFL